MNIVKSNSGIKSNGGKDRYLSSCVNSFYICSRICLCISKLCGKSKGIWKFHSLLGHLGEDKVRSSVYDSHHFRYMVGLEAVLQRADDRNSSGNSSLKQEIFLCSLGGFQNLFSVDCDQILVCSHHVLSGFQCCKNISTCRLNSSDQLDHNIYGRISFYICPVCCKNRCIFHLLRCFLKVTHQDLRDLYLTSKLGCHFLLLIFDNFIDSGSYCSKTKKGRIYDFFAHFLMSPFRFFQFLSE